MTVELRTREKVRGIIGHTAADIPFTPPSFRFHNYIIVVKGSDGWKLEQILYWMEVKNKTKLTEKDVIEIIQNIIHEGIEATWRGN